MQAASLNPDTFSPSRREYLDQITLEQCCRNLGAGAKALQTARLWSRGIFGQDPSDVSALNLLEVAKGGLGIFNIQSDSLHGAQHLRIQDGTQSISIGMYKLLPAGTVHLNNEVESITQKSHRIYEITTI